MNEQIEKLEHGLMVCEVTGTKLVHIEKADAEKILALLKEREAVKPIYNEEKYVDHLPHCGNCEKVLPNNAVYGKVNFCHYCGQAVKWDG